MDTEPTPPEADDATARVFQGAAGRLRLEPDEVLVREGDPQRRLYRLEAGAVVGYVHDEEGHAEPMMRAGPGDLVGVQSFFSGSHVSAMTVIATAPTELRYLERTRPPEPGPDDPLEVQLMGAVIGELTRRQRTLLEMARRQREADARLRELERTSALGQLAAGVAHELNNAIAVIASGADWLSENTAEQLDADDAVRRVFERGLERGRELSSDEVRRRAHALRRAHKLSAGRARKLAQTGLGEAELAAWHPVRDRVDRIVRAWELGATLNDLRVAAHQAQSVVASMRDLGASPGRSESSIDVNETIRTALQLLRSVRRGVRVDLEPGELPPIRANRGELVQIWSNLIKNACDALHGSPPAEAEPAVTIRSRAERDQVIVEVSDNGPGVPREIAERIFEPSFTTKRSGLSFGLGLGLSIVQNLVTGHGGQLELVSPEIGATFRVTLPIGA